MLSKCILFVKLLHFWFLQYPYQKHSNKKFKKIKLKICTYPDKPQSFQVSYEGKVHYMAQSLWTPAPHIHLTLPQTEVHIVLHVSACDTAKHPCLHTVYWLALLFVFYCIALYCFVLSVLYRLFCTISYLCTGLHICTVCGTV